MTTFKFGGTSLEDFGKVTVINEYLDMPERRGNNQTIPFRHGNLFVPKYFNERVFAFGITIIEDSAANLETSLDVLRALLSPKTEQTLEMTLESTLVLNIQANANKSMMVNRVAPHIAKVVIELQASSPIWRDVNDIPDNTTTIDTNPTLVTINNPGTAEERDPTIILTGPLSNTVITNTTNGCTLTYTGTIASPRVVTIETNATGEYIATDDLAVNVIGNITHSGASALMVLDVGDNDFSIADDTATTGTVKIVFKAPYL